MKRILILAVTLTVLAGVAGAVWWARQSLPVLDGEEHVSGLVAPAEVIFDQYGVPHVYAAGMEDAWATVGVLHARERLWQMELYRRAAYGRLSEVLGERTLPVDRRLLTLGLKAGAEAEWEAASPAVRTALTHYTDGVNAQRTRATGRFKPIEFQLLRFDPAPWTPVDSLAVGRLLAWRLAENHQSELVRHALAARFGMFEAQRLAGSYPGNGPTILSHTSNTPQPSFIETQADLTAHALSQLATRPEWPAGLEWLDPAARRGLSNNFVVSPRRTTTGRPLLANDPHLQIEFPVVWYEVHLVAAGLDVTGVSIPGTPFVVIGHNERIAWGVTNTGADVQDLYIERFDLARRRYLYQGQWLPVAITRADIPVRGRQPEPFEIWRTRHGPVFADLGLDWETPPDWLNPVTERRGERRAFALRWEIAGEMAGAFESLDRAGSWAEFLTAVEGFTAPSQNFVYADVDGNIGYAMSGVLPLRASGNGTMPIDGSIGEGEWTARVNPSTLPRAFNPPDGYITSSNNEVDRTWPGLITRDWAAPFRTTRLHQALESDKAITLDAATSLQNDLQSIAADRVLAGLPGAIAAAKKAGADRSVTNALEQLGVWDRKVDGRSVTALYEAFEAALWQRTFFDEMGEDLFNQFYEWAGAERPSGLYTVIDDPRSKWFDDIGTIDRRETRDEIMILAARDAVETLERNYGASGNWNWGRMHAARFSHPLAGGGFPLSWFLNPRPSEIAGDGTTVMRVSFNRRAPFGAWELPSWRQVLDVGHWDDSRVVLPAGQSGHPLSPHYFDQNEMWRTGHYRAQPFTRSAVDGVRAHRLVLLP